MLALDERARRNIRTQSLRLSELGSSLIAPKQV